jgi:hypothetical protein
MDLTESESSEEEVSLCILNQCLGCPDCQNSEALLAGERVRLLEAEIEDLQRQLRTAQEELEHFNLLQAAVCKHFFIVSLTEIKCNRCGLRRPRARG